MSTESDLVELLQTVCPRVYPDVAPAGATNPYIVWQGLGGNTLRFLDNTPASLRHGYLQIGVYSTTRAQSLALIRQAEDALCASGLFTAGPMGEPISTYEDDTKLFGSIQRFSIWGAR
ncbi:MAG: tail completion protein gp17 [Acidovorax sp.]